MDIRNLAMRRRTFLSGLLAVPAVTYFDMGRSWQKHDELWLPNPHTDGLTIRVRLNFDEKLISDGTPEYTLYQVSEVGVSEVWQETLRIKSLEWR